MREVATAAAKKPSCEYPIVTVTRSRSPSPDIDLSPQNQTRSGRQRKENEMTTTPAEVHDTQAALPLEGDFPQETLEEAVDYLVQLQQQEAYIDKMIERVKEFIAERVPEGKQQIGVYTVRVSTPLRFDAKKCAERFPITDRPELWDKPAPKISTKKISALVEDPDELEGLKVAGKPVVRIS